MTEGPTSTTPTTDIDKAVVNVGLHDLAARTREAIDKTQAELPRFFDNVKTRSQDDRERLAADLAAYDLAVEGLRDHYDLVYCDMGGKCPDARRYTALRDAAEANVERTARLYGVAP